MAKRKRSKKGKGKSNDAMMGFGGPRTAKAIIGGRGSDDMIGSGRPEKRKKSKKGDTDILGI